MRLKLDGKIYDLQLTSGLDIDDRIIVVEILKNLAENESRFFTLCKIPVECEDV